MFQCVPSATCFSKAPIDKKKTLIEVNYVRIKKQMCDYYCRMYIDWALAGQRNTTGFIHYATGGSGGFPSVHLL